MEINNIIFWAEGLTRKHQRHREEKERGERWNGGGRGMPCIRVMTEEWREGEVREERRGVGDRDSQPVRGELGKGRDVGRRMGSVPDQEIEVLLQSCCCRRRRRGCWRWCCSAPRRPAAHGTNCNILNLEVAVEGRRKVFPSSCSSLFTPQFSPTGRRWALPQPPPLS